MKFWPILLPFLTILIIIPSTKASEGGECHECREREKMCRPDIDWRENWIPKEVPVPGIEVKREIVERKVPIDEVKIEEVEIKKPVTVPIQQVNVEYEWIDREKIVEVPEYEVVERFIEKFIDVPEIVDKVEKVQREILVPKKVVKVIPVKVTVDRQEPRPRLHKREQKVMKPVGVPKLNVLLEKVDKNVMVHETTYKFCRVGVGGEEKPSNCGGDDGGQICSPCKKCKSCGKPGYTYKAPGGHIPRLNDPNSSSGAVDSNDGSKSEEDDDDYYEQN